MADRRSANRVVCLEHAFDRLLAIKLEQVYRILVPERVRITGSGSRVKDPRIVALVRLMLKAAVIMPDGTKIAVQEGTPQGGPLTP